MTFIEKISNYFNSKAFFDGDNEIQYSTKKTLDISDMVSFSEKKLKEAYSRMNMSTHKWTKGTMNEVNFILQYGDSNTILDLGCGHGRHAIALAQKNCVVTAVDFSQKI